MTDFDKILPVVGWDDAVVCRLQGLALYDPDIKLALRVIARMELESRAARAELEAARDELREYDRHFADMIKL